MVNQLEVGLEEEVQPETQFILPSNANPREYIQIPQCDLVIAQYEPDWTKNLQWANDIDNPTSGAHFVV